MKYLTTISKFTIKKSILYLVKYDFRLVFDEYFYRHIRSELQKILTKFQLKKFLLTWIACSIERGYKFSHNYEMNITSFSPITNTNFQFYNKRPIAMLEVKLNMILHANPHLLK